MGFLYRFRSPEERERREREAAEKEATRAAAAALAEQQRLAAQEAAQRARMRQILGDDLVDMEVNSPDEAKIAIKLARLRKKELQAEKRELAAELADVREEWRDRQAGRISTVGLGRGMGGRIMRGTIQANRRGERMQQAERVNAFSDARQDLDQQIVVIDRMIIDLERWTLKKG